MAVPGRWFENRNLESAEYDEIKGYTRAQPKYRYKGIGKLYYQDEKKRRNLYDAVAYIAKREQAVPLRPKGFRVWGRGEMPAVARKKTGAPRKHG